jgi:hemerythrin-like domain-containing protein
MKRDPALARLSHDHQHGLAVALQLRRATEQTAAAAKTAFQSFWEAEGRHHFGVEEEILLPHSARRLPADHEAVVRVLVDHVELRRRAADLALASAPSAEDLHGLGEQLHTHIRHEERVLFPLIEAALSQGELDELATAIEKAERRG